MSDSRDKEYILRQYADQIALQARWTLRAAAELNDSSASEISEVFRKATQVVVHAMAVLRFLDACGARNKHVAENRVRLIKERWPTIPEPPAGLREIRNDLEHFDEKLDKWATSSKRRNLADLNIMPPGSIMGLEEVENLRSYHDGVFYFWSHSVDLSEVRKWVEEVAKCLKS